MSNFSFEARDRKTNHIHEVTAFDGYFGGRNYGYEVDGEVLPMNEFMEKYERTDHANI
jgi:hypothetical protein